MEKKKRYPKLHKEGETSKGNPSECGTTQGRGKDYGQRCEPSKERGSVIQKNRKENKREKTTYITNLRATTVGNKRKRE